MPTLDCTVSPNSWVSGLLAVRGCLGVPIMPRQGMACLSLFSLSLSLSLPLSLLSLLKLRAKQIRGLIFDPSVGREGEKAFFRRAPRIVSIHMINFAGMPGSG